MLIEDVKSPTGSQGQYMRSGEPPGRYDTHTASRGQVHAQRANSGPVYDTYTGQPDSTCSGANSAGMTRTMTSRDSTCAAGELRAGMTRTHGQPGTVHAQRANSGPV